MSFFSRFSTPVFKNTGSTARDHLASERTYLAWMRTGLGFLALGIGVERFNQLDLAEILPTKHKKRFHEDKTHNDKSDALVGALLGSGAGSIAYGTARVEHLCLEATVFWELTDRRHNPPSPNVGHAKFSPVPYSYVIPRLNLDFQDDEPCNDEPQVMMSDATRVVGDSGDPACSKEGYPNAPSPTSRRLTRAATKLKAIKHESKNVSASSQALESLASAIKSPKQPATRQSLTISAEDQAVNNDVVPRLNALTLITTLDNGLPSSHHLTQAHLSRKARILSTKTVRGFRIPSHRVSKPEKPKPNQSTMYKLAKWTGQDKERKGKVAALLHARTEVRTKGLEDPF
ncbi:hypothetical protein E4T39_03938 [Aureobasidium subglaciale]|nr:hypothetical protein E4T39_03938 [Aureobasidium subglaciale]